MQRIIWSGLMAGVGVVGMMAPVAAQPVVQDIRLGQHPDRTRLVIDLSETAGFSITPENGGSRFVVDLPEVEAGNDTGDVAGLGLIDKVSRFKRSDAPGFRLVLDMDQPARLAQAFTLAATEAQPVRLVIDLAPAPRSAAPQAPEPEAGQPASPAQDRQQAALTPEPPPSTAPRPPAAEETPPAGESKAPVMMAGAEPPGAGPEAPTAIALDSMRQEWSGYIQSEVRLYPQTLPGKSELDGSAAVELTYEASWNNGLQSITVTPFARGDIEDGSRTHVDIREAKWTGVFGPVEVRVGIDRVFWGVTESEHLVDVINQTDGVEDIDDEDKLGQPLASLAWNSPAGTVTGYVLPYFRERTFPGDYSRPYDLRVADELAQFSSSHHKWRDDWAVRYANAIGPFDVGLSYFSGMQRDPYLVPTLVGPEAVLIPFYEVVHQASADLQGTFGPLLLKFEGMTVDRPNADRYYAAAGGFEYTVFNVFGGAGDLGFLSEYMYDDRGQNAQNPLQDDLFVGMRFSGNNVNTTQVLAGAIFDLETSTVAANIEASQRLAQQWLLSLDARLFLDVAPQDPLIYLSHGDFLQLRLARYF